MRRRVVVVLSFASLLFGCGTSDRDRVAQRMETYAHVSADGDIDAACQALTPGYRKQRAPQCGTAINPKQPSPLLLMFAGGHATKIAVHGDHADGYLKLGDCVVRMTHTYLVRERSGQWLIDNVGEAQIESTPFCIEGSARR